jgi:hypothetical protein
VAKIVDTLWYFVGGPLQFPLIPPFCAQLTCFQISASHNEIPAVSKHNAAQGETMGRSCVHATVKGFEQIDIIPAQGVSDASVSTGDQHRLICQHSLLDALQIFYFVVAFIFGPTKACFV